MDPFYQFYHDPTVRAAAATAGLLIPRVLPVIVLTPIFGGNILPNRLRIGITMLIVLVMLPAAAQQGLGQSFTGGQYLAIAAKELLIGLTLSTMILVMYQTFVAAGSAIDLSRGATIANVFDPATQQQQSLLGTFFLQLAIVLFLTIGGAHVVIDAWADSMTALPVYEMLPARLVGADAIPLMIQLVADLFVIAVRLAAPVLLVIILLDIVLGLLNRVAPQIQVFFLGLTIKATLGLLILFLGFAVIFDQFGEQFVYFLKVMKRWIVTG